MFDQFGGVYVIVDIIQSEYRIRDKVCTHKKCCEFRVDLMAVLTDPEIKHSPGFYWDLDNFLNESQSLTSLLIDMLNVETNHRLIEALACLIKKMVICGQLE